MAMVSVPIRTNAETRRSRLFKSMWSYMKRSASVIIRSFMMYKPLKFFGVLGLIFLTAGLIFGIRFMFFYIQGLSEEYIKSMVIAAVLVVLAIIIFVFGLLSDIIASNRKLLEDIQYRVRKMECQEEPRKEEQTGYNGESQ